MQGRLPARFVRRLGPDASRSGCQRASRGSTDRRRASRRVPVPSGTTVSIEDPVRPRSTRGHLVHLEFDRQRYEPEGQWLAYVYLPSRRMLNAELIRLGLARPLADARNIRYLDLFDELAPTGNDFRTADAAVRRRHKPDPVGGLGSGQGPPSRPVRRAVTDLRDRNQRFRATTPKVTISPPRNSPVSPRRLPEQSARSQFPRPASQVNRIVKKLTSTVSPLEPIQASQRRSQILPPAHCAPEPQSRRSTWP